MLLNGWKEIASHAKRGVRTVQRWERLGMPVTRVNESAKSPVIARSEEIDRWLTRSRGANPQKGRLLAEIAEERRVELRKQVDALVRRRVELTEEAKRFKRVVPVEKR